MKLNQIAKVKVKDRPKRECKYSLNTAKGLLYFKEWIHAYSYRERHHNEEIKQWLELMDGYKIVDGDITNEKELDRLEQIIFERHGIPKNINKISLYNYFKSLL